MLNSAFFDAGRPPLTKGITLALVITAIISTFVLHFRSGAGTDAVALSLAIVSISLVVYGWFVLDRERDSRPRIDSMSDIQSDSEANQTGAKAVYFSRGLLLVCAGTLIAIANTYINNLGTGSSIAVMSGFFAIILYDLGGRKSRLAGLILSPMLCGSVFIGTAGALGNPLVGLFPGVISLLFMLVIRVTLDLESEISTHHNDADDAEIFHHFRHRLAWTAIAFFFFGVVSFWPWLGMTYSHAYFWILVLGVILPLVFFWGRLRQPRSEGAQVALLRFNRISPVIAFVLIFAFAIG
jgi:hypothetical protein